MGDFVLPKMLVGDELIKAMTVLPKYDESIREKEPDVRLAVLSDIFSIYIPSIMSVEIYSKLYLSLVRSLSKKGTTTAVRQHYINHDVIMGGVGSGIIGGSDSYTIIGCSGLGKSTAISRSVSLICDRVIETKKPYSKIIPFLTVQTPFDSSVKSLLYEILRKTDEIIGSSYYKNAVRSKMTTTDMLIGSVSSVAIKHIGVLIVDETQNVVNSKNGKQLVGMLTQLINSSGISICMVGTPECAIFFEQALQLARRSVGLCYDKLDLDDYFCRFCETVFSYQYVRNNTEISPSIISWLYEHSGGIVSIVISLIHDAQEIAILKGSETLDIETLTIAYEERISMLHSYIAPKKNKVNSATKKSAKNPIANVVTCVADIEKSVSDVISDAKVNETDIVSALKSVFTIEEVDI